ncbi:MAG: DUF4136 domain-containing protein [Planctomycetes bacterium]|nr:DUF4136 domain-containing protein [Planctomycetota bacterium]
MTSLVILGRRAARFGAAALFLTACTGVERRRDPDYPFAAVTTYAWKEPAHFTGTNEDKPYVLGEVTTEIDAALKQRGLQRVEKGEAQVLLSAVVGFDRRLLRKEPQYSVYRVEDIEHAVLTVQVFDRLQRRSVWEADARRPLRVVAHAFGGAVERFTPVDEPRVWRIEEMVGDVVAELPLGAR